MSKLNLVTGANGHLGNNLVRALLAQGETVRASVRNPQNRAPFTGLDCEIVKADLMDKPSLLKALEGVDTLYQVAAVFKHWARDPQKEIIEPNLRGTRNIMEAAAEQGVRRIVYVSSTATLPHAIGSVVDETQWCTDFHNNAYYQSKTEAEQLAWRLADELSLSMVTVLPCGIVGPHTFNLTPTMGMLQRIVQGNLPLDINFYFNIVDVRDVADGMIAAAQKGRAGERYMLATEDPISTKQLMQLAQEFNPKVKVGRRVPRWLLLGVANLMEGVSKLTGKAPMIMRNQVTLYYGAKFRMDASKARADLGFAPRDSKTAIRQAYADLLKN